MAPARMGRMYLNFPASAWLEATDDEVRGLVAEAIRLYLDELERDENAAAESVVVNHYTISV